MTNTDTAISLSKGDRINLSKKSKTPLHNIKASLGWVSHPLVDVDVDISAFVCKHVGNAPTLLGNPWFVFYGNLASPDQRVLHLGDNRTGSKSGGECETISVDLKNILPQVDEISFVVTIHDALRLDQTFGIIKNAYIEIVNSESNEVLVRYELSSEFYSETAVQVGSLFKQQSGEWDFQAIGSGSTTKEGRTLADFVLGYGGTLQ